MKKVKNKINFTKIISITGVFLLLISFLARPYSRITEVLATDDNDCDDNYTYTVDEEDEDGAILTFSESGNKVEIDFNDTDGNPQSSDDFNQLVITAGSGYELTSVKYDTETSGTNYVSFAVSNPTTTINLAGNGDSSRIDKVEVKVKKTCAPWAVAITEQISCGSGQKTFTGTASYGGDTSTTLLVKFSGNTVIDSESENTSWSFNQSVTNGSAYTILASVYSDSNPDVSGSNQDTPKATDTWTFTVPSCQQDPSPTATPTNTPSVTPTPSTASNSPTPTPTSTQDDVTSPTVTQTEVPSPTPTDSQNVTVDENSPTPTATPTNSPSLTPTPTSNGQSSTTASAPSDTGVGGQVLGATTLASTGSADTSLFMLGLMLLGSSFYGLSLKTGSKKN